MISGQVGSKYISVVSNKEESDDLTNPKVLGLSTFSHEGSGDDSEDDDDNDGKDKNRTSFVVFKINLPINQCGRTTENHLSDFLCKTNEFCLLIDDKLQLF